MKNWLRNIKLSQKGFTLFELLTVMMIMAILASIAVPSYKHSQIKSKESVLAEDLYQMRRMIDAFFADSARYPDDLEELMDKRYLRDIPRDPFTMTPDSWICISPDPSDNGQIAEGNCFDVHSGSKLVGLNNIPYQDW